MPAAQPCSSLMRLRLGRTFSKCLPGRQAWVLRCALHWFCVGSLVLGYLTGIWRFYELLTCPASVLAELMASQCAQAARRNSRRRGRTRGGQRWRS